MLTCSATVKGSRLMVLRSDSVHRVYNIRESNGQGHLSLRTFIRFNGNIIQKSNIQILDSFSFLFLGLFSMCKIVRILFFQLLLLLRIDGAALNSKGIPQKSRFFEKKIFLVWASVNSYNRDATMMTRSNFTLVSLLSTYRHTCAIYM